jgi:hypothetical protein
LLDQRGRVDDHGVLAAGFGDQHHGLAVGAQLAAVCRASGRATRWSR